MASGGLFWAVTPASSKKRTPCSMPLDLAHLLRMERVWGLASRSSRKALWKAIMVLRTSFMPPGP